MKKPQNRDDATLDLFEMRRQLAALRSQHSEDLVVVSLINRFLVTVAFLSAPIDRAHEQHLRSEFTHTLQKVEAIVSRPSSAKRRGTTTPAKKREL